MTTLGKTHTDISLHVKTQHVACEFLVANMLRRVNETIAAAPRNKSALTIVVCVVPYKELSRCVTVHEDTFECKFVDRFVRDPCTSTYSIKELLDGVVEEHEYALSMFHDKLNAICSDDNYRISHIRYFNNKGTNIVVHMDNPRFCSESTTEDDVSFSLSV